MLDGERVDVILVTGVENHLPAPTNVTCLCHVWACVAPELYKGKEMSPGILSFLLERFQSVWLLSKIIFDYSN